MRRCVCGCERFQAEITQEVKMTGTVVFNDSGCGDIVSVDDHEDVVSTDYDGPFVCEDCGAVYESENNIPDYDGEYEDIEDMPGGDDDEAV